MRPEITSTANPRIKALVRLHRRRERDAGQVFIVEGAREVGRAVGAGLDLVDLYVCPSLFSEEAGEVFARPALLDLPATPLAEVVFRKASLRENPDGLLAVARTFPVGLADLDLPAAPLVLVVEAIEKPGNLGAMMRTAAAAGVSAVVACDPATDPFNPNVVRASQGALFSTPLAVAGAAEVRDWLSACGIRPLAASPSGGTDLWTADYRGAVAVVVGSEHAGLSAIWLHESITPVHIPMPGAHPARVDSLNAGVAAGIMLFEALRQRRIGVRTGSGDGGTSPTPRPR